MNYVPINGLRMLAVESGILFAAFLIAYISLRFLHPAMNRPRWLAWILGSNLRSVLLVIAVALAGRALLLPVVGIPSPRINDEYSYLLMADTFSHHRLTNPTPPAWQHFETFHVNMTPTYHSKYPGVAGTRVGVRADRFPSALDRRIPEHGSAVRRNLLVPASLRASGMGAARRVAGGGPHRAFVLLDEFLLGRVHGRARRRACSRRCGAAISSRAHKPASVCGSHALLQSPCSSSLPRVPMKGLAFSIPLLAYFGYKETRARDSPGSEASFNGVASRGYRIGWRLL